MTTTYQEIEKWKKEGIQMGATHIISVCDTFDWDDYPVYVMPNENLEEKKKQFSSGNNMQKINEIITL
jgi:hypothetical protein